MGTHARAAVHQEVGALRDERSRHNADKAQRGTQRRAANTSGVWLRTFCRLSASPSRSPRRTQSGRPAEYDAAMLAARDHIRGAPAGAVGGGFQGEGGGARRARDRAAACRCTTTGWRA